MLYVENEDFVLIIGKFLISAFYFLLVQKNAYLVLGKHFKFYNNFLPIAFETKSSSFIRASNLLGFKDCGPSLMAFGGSK